jgi:hypothetical protein
MIGGQKLVKQLFVLLLFVLRSFVNQTIQFVKARLEELCSRPFHVEVQGVG